MYKKAARHLKNEKGQALVETALVLPILLMLICGIVDFGWIFGNHVVVENGSREGARLGAVVGTKSDYISQISSRVIAVTPGYSHGGITTSATLSKPSDPSTGDVTVTVRYKFRLLTPMAQIILGKQDYTAVATCVMKVE